MRDLDQRSLLGVWSSYSLRRLAAVTTAYIFLGAISAVAQSVTVGSPPGMGNPVVISLEEAIRLAQANEPAYAASKAASRIAGLDRSIALGSLMPSVVYNKQAIYTQGNGQIIGQEPGTTSSTSPRFISSNGVHEYISQASINETIGLRGVAEFHRADAEAARARAEAEVARRGLVVAVTTLFYNSLTGDRKLAVAERAHQEAADFVRLTMQDPINLAR